ncbi:MAG: hypothetical protein MK060_20305 [Blastomonas sp.]|jgi:hypothetical protein|uniref:hypothetical protein n=1 Tax=unclassified Blastomonas TaxID=2626550 RepID=UPI000A896BBF|nr:hypothetical protein [Blastomonas sp.]MCH2240219.1 hypothetical protein [Blastomonas sp.]
MTLQNGLVHGRKSFVWVDTALWDGHSGEIMSYASKAFQGESWPFAATFSTWGPSHQALIEIMKAADPENLDEALEIASDALRWFVSIGGFGRILMASFEGRPRLHVVPSGELFPGYAPFEPVELDYYVCSANHTDAFKVAARKGFNPKRMRRVVDAQCETPWAVESGAVALAERVWIGGDIVRLEVGADGVTSAVERTVQM